jgi:hypothetical protein
MVDDVPHVVTHSKQLNHLIVQRPTFKTLIFQICPRWLLKHFEVQIKDCSKSRTVETFSVSLHTAHRRTEFRIPVTNWQSKLNFLTRDCIEISSGSVVFEPVRTRSQKISAARTLDWTIGPVPPSS